jgi:hypothetical protein
MRKRLTVDVQETKFQREFSTMIDGFEIAQGDIFKVKGEYGVKFKFYSLTTNTETGAQWIDCFEMHRAQTGAYRSFKSDRIKRIPQKGKRARRVNN